MKIGLPDVRALEGGKDRALHICWVLEFLDLARATISNDLPESLHSLGVKRRRSLYKKQYYGGYFREGRQKHEI